jgi:hypothetical protein
VVAIFASLGDDPDRLAAAEGDFLAFAEDANSGPAEGPAEYQYEYLLVLGRKRD